MVIDKETRNELMSWNDEESIYKQFEEKCAKLSEISGMDIDPSMYQLQYDLHASSMDTYVNLQTETYEFLSKKYSNLDFGLAGRLKSPYSHYEKVIRKFLDYFEKDEFKEVEILDDYAMKVFILSINLDIDKVSFDSEGVYVDCGIDEYRLTNNDVFVIPYNGKNISIRVLVEDETSKETNILIKDGNPYIKTEVDGNEITLRLKDAVTYKKSDKADLIEYCKDLQEDIETFFIAKGFNFKKRKDYISHPKKSGYESIHSTFYSEEAGLGMECQLRTYDMELYSNFERTIGYKPKEKSVSANSLKKTPKFALTTRFADGVYTYTMTDSECFEYVYGMSLQEYRKKMLPNPKKAIIRKNSPNMDDSGVLK